MAAAVGSLIGWRGWLICVGGLAFAASLSLFVAVGRGTAGHLRGGVRPSLRTALSPKVLGLLGTGIAERICYGLAAVYFATFLQATYHLSLVETAIPLAVFALGNVAGTILGGQLADRLRDRLLTFAIAMALSGVAALALFMWHPNVTISVALGSSETMRGPLMHGPRRRGPGRRCGPGRHRRSSPSPGCGSS